MKERPIRRTGKYYCPLCKGKTMHRHWTTESDLDQVYATPEELKILQASYKRWWQCERCLIREKIEQSTEDYD